MQKQQRDLGRPTRSLQCKQGSLFANFLMLKKMSKVSLISVKTVLPASGAFKGLGLVLNKSFPPISLGSGTLRKKGQEVCMRQKID